MNNQFIIVSYYVEMGEYEKAKKLGELILQTAIDYYKAGEKRAKGTGLLLTFGARQTHWPGNRIGIEFKL